MARAPAASSASSTAGVASGPGHRQRSARRCPRRARAARVPGTAPRTRGSLAVRGSWASATARLGGGALLAGLQQALAQLGLLLRRRVEGGRVGQLVERVQPEQLLEQRRWCGRARRRTASGPTPRSARARAACRRPTRTRRRGCERSPAARPAAGRRRSRGISACACVSGGVRGRASSRRAACSATGSVASVKPPADLAQDHAAAALRVVLAQRARAPRRPRPPPTSQASASASTGTGSADRNSSASTIVASSFTQRSPADLDGDRAERHVLLPGRLACLVELEQREQRDGLGHAVGALDGVVEAKRPRARSRSRRCARRCSHRHLRHRHVARGRARRREAQQRRRSPRPGARARRRPRRASSDTRRSRGGSGARAVAEAATRPRAARAGSAAAPR